jgi:DNA-binding protein HU-beta
MARSSTKTPTKKAPARGTAAKAAAAKSGAKSSAKSSAKATAKASAGKAAKKPAKAPAEKSSGVLSLRNIADRLSEAHELPKRQANEILTSMVELIAKSLKKGDKIRLNGLGILQVRKRAARMGRNPQTGEPVKIKASKKIAFRAAKDLKEAI